MNREKTAKIGTLLFFLFFIFHACSSYANTIIFSPSNEKALAISKKIASQIPDSKVCNSLPSEDSYTLLITIGNESYQQARNRQSSPHIAAFVSYNIFNSSDIKNGAEKYAIYSDPDPHEVTSYIHRSIGSPRIAYVYTDRDEPYLHLLKKEDITINELPLLERDVFKTLSFLYRSPSSDAIFISENRSIYSKSNILLVLESLFRNRLPVISTNLAFYGKGSLLTIYVEQDAITKKTIESANRLRLNQSVSIDNFVRSKTKSDLDLAKHLNVIVGGEDD